MAGALLQRELVSIKSGGAAVTRNGQYKKQGALPQREMVSVNGGGAATARIEIGRAHV